MKVAVSIPDPVFTQAERLSRELGTSRSKLYARALAEFVKAHAASHVTRAIDESLEGIDQTEDGLWLDVARRQVLKRTEW